MHAAELFGNLQSFMSQELDQAMATQALRHTLSSRVGVSLRPEGWSGKGFPSCRAFLVASAACCILYALASPSRGAVSKVTVCPAILTYLLSTSQAKM